MKIILKYIIYLDGQYSIVFNYTGDNLYYFSVPIVLVFQAMPTNVKLFGSLNWITPVLKADDFLYFEE